MQSFNLSKCAQFKIEEKMLADNRDKTDNHAEDNTGNIDWLLRSVRKNQTGDRIYESQLDDVRSNDDSQVITDAALDKAQNPIYRVRIPAGETPPLMDYAQKHEQEAAKIFDTADNEGKNKRDISFWDKYVGEQLLGPKTVIVNNVQPSQLLSNYRERAAMNKENPSTKMAAAMDSLKDADAMLYHIYRNAADLNRDLTEGEKQMVVDINSGKLRVLSQFSAKPKRTEDAFTDVERNEEDRYEKFELGVADRFESELGDELRELLQGEADADADVLIENDIPVSKPLDIEEEIPF